jgi:hypothetical protein
VDSRLLYPFGHHDRRRTRQTTQTHDVYGADANELATWGSHHLNYRSRRSVAVRSDSLRATQLPATPDGLQLTALCLRSTLRTVSVRSTVVLIWLVNLNSKPIRLNTPLVY